MISIRIRGAAALLLFALCSLAPVGAITPTAAATTSPPTALLSEYSHLALRGSDGAPVDVLKFAQTPDGWLWIATSVGLYRYDGIQFELVDTVYGWPLGSSDVTGVNTDRSGALWVGYRYGRISVFTKHGTRMFSEADGVPGGAVFHIEPGPDGSLWIATRDGVARLSPGSDRFERQGTEIGLPSSRIFQILFCKDGTQWVASVAGAFFRKAGQQRFTHAWPRTMLTSMDEAPDGTVWATDPGRNYYRVRTVAPKPHDPPRPEMMGIGIRFDRDGQAWLLQPGAVERKLSLTKPAVASQRLTMTNGLSGALPQSIFQDREGTIWIGTSAGIDKLRRNRLRPLSVSSELDGPGMVPGPDGTVWIGDHAGDIQSVDRAGRTRPVFPGHMSASHWTHEGSLWIGNDRGLRQRAPDGKVTTVPPPEGVEGFEPQAIQQDRSGALWVAYGGGTLWRWNAGAWEREVRFPERAGGSVMTMAMDDTGIVWLGRSGSTISLIGNSPARPIVATFGAQQGLNVGAVRYLYRDRGLMWVGGERGTMLYRDGRFMALRGSGGEAFRGVSGILRLPDGDLWLHGADGIFHIRSNSLTAWLDRPEQDVEFERFDALDGLKGHAPQLRPLPSLIQAPDGVLWFSTGSAISHIDPARIDRNPLPPPVQIRSVRVGDQTFALPNRGSLVLPKGTSTLQVDFTALSLAMPERVRFRYRLEGVDSDWQEPLKRRSAYYTNVGPGTYRFEVSAANEDGIWNATGAVIELRIPPTFVQTHAFHALLALAAGLLLYAAYVLRIRYITRRLQLRLEERMAERSRIARSLHDTLLPGMQGVLMSFDAHAHSLPPDSRERPHLNRVLAHARNMVAESRDEILKLRTPAGAGDLALSLSRIGDELAEYYGHAFDVHLSGLSRPIALQVCEELHGIGREALLNAARHAKANLVVLELDYGDTAFVLRVCDNGIGMDGDQSVHKAGHWGIIGIRERAAAIGARLDLRSHPGAGTQIEVTVPRSLAYVSRVQMWRRALGVLLGRTGRQDANIRRENSHENL